MTEAEGPNGGKFQLFNGLAIIRRPVLRMRKLASRVVGYRKGHSAKLAPAQESSPRAAQSRQCLEPARWQADIAQLLP